MKHEARVTTIWNKYCRVSKTRGAFELKYTSSDKFYLSHFEEHQLSSLIAIANNGLVWKLSDADTREKPADVLSIPPLESYVVICFKNTFYMIDTEDILTLVESGVKSISKQEAEELSVKVINM